MIFIAMNLSLLVDLEFSYTC